MLTDLKSHHLDNGKLALPEIFFFMTQENVISPRITLTSELI